MAEGKKKALQNWIWSGLNLGPSVVLILGARRLIEFVGKRKEKRGKA